MPVNPHDPAEIERRAQINALRGQAPVATTMPVGGAPQVIPDATPPIAGAQVFEGFDFGREQNKGKSAKDAFAHYSKLAPTAPTNNKDALAQWFEQYIRPGMNADGHGVQAAHGDKFRFKNWQGEFDVDYGRGAGAEGGALAWQADPAGMAAQADAAAISGAPSAPMAPQAPMGQVNPALDNSALSRIMAELHATANDEPSPAEREAMLAMLQGSI